MKQLKATFINGLLSLYALPYSEILFIPALYQQIEKNESTFFPINDSSFKIVQQKRHLCKLYLTYLQKAFNYKSKVSLMSN